MKNSCYTIPPGSNFEGINPKSQPLFNKGPSLKKRVGSPQKLLGYYFLNLTIFSAQSLAYGSFSLAIPPNII